MPVLITDTAQAQYLGMVGRYLRAAPHRPARPDAARRLIETYDVALARIAADPHPWLTHPGPYPALARYGFRWIKLHRYWFAWRFMTTHAILHVVQYPPGRLGQLPI